MLFCWILKGETHKLFWPEQSEFVRMAARFGCTIIPISSFGEDEVLDVCFLILALDHIECGSSVLLHNSWELLGTVVVLEMDVVKSSM
jgi:hypothetical protein